MRSTTLIRPLLVPTLLAALGACAAVSAPGNAASDVVADGSDFTMQPGAQVTFADHGRLHYLRVVSDSRCQPDVQCVWAGDAEVAFQWIPPQGPAADFSLHTGKGAKEQTVGGRRLTLVSLSRGSAPSAGLRIERMAAP